MTVHFQRELKKVKQNILFLGGMVERNLYNAIDALDKVDVKLAREVIKGDVEIDKKEVEIEEECLKIIALYQPLARDLRFITAVIKINNDLERVGDEATNIARRVIEISKCSFKSPPVRYIEMGERSREMLKISLDSLVNLDLDLAYKVCMMDDELDRINRENYKYVKKAIQENKSNGGVILDLLLVSRHLERVGDHATNIAEEVIYMIEGKIPRHSGMSL